MLNKIQTKYIALFLSATTLTQAIVIPKAVSAKEENILVIGSPEQIDKAIDKEIEEKNKNFEMTSDSVKVIPFKKSNQLIITYDIPYNLSEHYEEISSPKSNENIIKDMESKARYELINLDKKIKNKIITFLRENDFSEERITQMLNEQGNSAIDHKIKLVEVHLRGFSSPEGNYNKNKELATKRGIKDEKLIESILHNQFGNETKLKIKVKKGEVITNNTHITNVVHILNHTFNENLNVGSIERAHQEELDKLTSLIRRAKIEHHEIYNQIQNEFNHLRKASMKIIIHMNSTATIAKIIVLKKVEKEKATIENKTTKKVTYQIKKKLWTLAKKEQTQLSHNHIINKNLPRLEAKGARHGPKFGKL